MPIFMRLAQIKDLTTIYDLILQGKKLLAADQIPQWQGDYPQKTDLQRDITKKYAYVLLKGDQLVGSATLFQEPDPNYQQIFAGNWQKGPAAKYATIHRITIDPHFSGQHLGDFFFSNLVSEAYRLGFREIRIDTHEKNQRMRHLIAKAGFSYSGIVYMNRDPHDQRLAYQLFLK